jgi:hypothetical protein
MFGSYHSEKVEVTDLANPPLVVLRVLRVLGSKSKTTLWLVYQRITAAPENACERTMRLHERNT